MENLTNLEPKKEYYNNFFMYVQVILVLLVFSVTNIRVIGQFLPNVISQTITSNNFISLLLIFNVVLVFLFHRPQMDNLRLFSNGIFFIVIIFVIIYINITLNDGGAVQLFSYFFRDIYIFLIIVNLSFSFSFNLDRMKLIIISICTIEALLGCVQHIMNIPIFKTEMNGASVFNAIFFYNGSSSNKSWAFGSLATVRAFGTTDSGLTLGILMIFGVAVILSKNFRNHFIKYSLLTLFSVTIYFTVTRNDYIAYVIFILLMTIKKYMLNNKVLMKFVYLVTLLISSSVLWINGFLNMLIKLANSANISTFSDRFRYLDIVFNQIVDIKHLLFGSQIVQTGDLPIDNSFIAYTMNYGLFFAILISFFMYFVFRYCISNMLNTNYSLVIFLLLYPLISMSNNVLFSFATLTVLVLIIIKKEKQEYSERIQIRKNIIKM